MLYMILDFSCEYLLLKMKPAFSQHIDLSELPVDHFLNVRVHSPPLEELISNDMSVFNIERKENSAMGNIL